MEQITLRVEPDTKKSLQEEADEAGENLSEYIRNILRNRHDDDRGRDRVDELEERVAELQEEREDLIRDSVRVEYLEDELERVREERDEALRRAERNEAKLAVHSSEKGLVTRLKDRLS